MDERLEATTLAVATLDGWHVRLVNDARWPWLMLVPQREGGREGPREVDDLTDEEAVAMARLTRLIVRELRAQGSHKTNVATIGNVVEAFHLHVVGRSPGDPNWPAPVWGFGRAVPYGEDGEGTAQDFARVLQGHR